LAIRWPNNEKPPLENSFKSSVNLFRILFSYLAEDPQLLNHLQEDASFIPIKIGAPEGIYKYIDSNGKIVFDKHE